MYKKGSFCKATIENIVSNELHPKVRYITEKPNSKKQEIIAPNTKYFKPDSDEYSEVLSKVANT